MKKYLYGFMIVVLTLIVGCQSKEEKIQIQINELNTIADQYYNDGKFEEAIDNYKKILELKDVDETRKKVDDIEEEIENAKQVKIFLDELYTIEKERLRSGITVTSSDMEYIIKDLKGLVSEFELIDTTRDTEINHFINEIKQDASFHSYQWLKEEVNNEIYNDGGTTDMLSELDSSFGVFASSVTALNRDWVTESVQNILNKQFPVKYKSIVR